MAANLAETTRGIDKSYIPMRRNAEDVQAERQIQEDEYDPFAARPSAPLTSDFAVYMHLLKCAIGTGILFLPHAFRRTGYAMSIVCGIVMGMLCMHVAVILVCENVESDDFFHLECYRVIVFQKQLARNAKEREAYPLVYNSCPYIVSR